VIQEMSLGIHYNTEGYDLLTYLTDKSAFDMADGCVGVPTGPGLGVSIDESMVRELDRNPHSGAIRFGARRMELWPNGSLEDRPILPLQAQRRL
jgi:hypothetical protein